ncbi:MAG: DUF6686 family protein [Bacteroidota bacterium]
MCSYQLLSQGPLGSIRWCKTCGTFNILFNNISFSFKPEAFQKFKRNVSDCYAHYSQSNCAVKKRDIVFNTSSAGVHFVFSVNELGELLFLMQTAELCHVSPEELDEPPLV